MEMNLETLSNVYQSAKTLSSLLGNGGNIEECFKNMTLNPQSRARYVAALASLEVNLRVMGMTTLIGEEQK